jgi:hypothetical protein
MRKTDIDLDYVNGASTACLPQCTGCARHDRFRGLGEMLITCHDLRHYALREHPYADDWGTRRIRGPSPEFMLR